MRCVSAGLVLMLAMLMLATFGAPLAPARADDLPHRPITLVLPLGAGGAMDIIARSYLAPRLADILGRSIVVENRTGGGTVIGANAVAKAPADGSTLLFAPAGTLTINSTLFKSLPYDPGKDFVPVALTSQVAFVLVINPSLPVKTVAELVQYGRDNPGKLSYASTGTGATPHFAGELLKQMGGFEMTHVPYKGSPPALNDVIANHVQMTFTDPAISPPMIAEGKVRALGVSSLQRVGVLADVPTLSESGLPGFEVVSWHMVAAPANTPREIVDKLHAAFKAVTALPEYKQEVIKIGLIPLEQPSVDELRRYLDAEIDRWGRLVVQLGLKGTQ
jgi:tripartite-type tricarboxylate transporter receptor subunit TctC